MLVVLSDLASKFVPEIISNWVSNLFHYKLKLSFVLSNCRSLLKNGKIDGPIISIFVTIRNVGSKLEYVHACGFDGTYSGDSAMSNAVEWNSSPLQLDARSMHQCELRFHQDHNPVIKAVWVENALQKRWFLPKKELAKLNRQIKEVVERNRADLIALKSQEVTSQVQTSYLPKGDPNTSWMA